MPERARAIAIVAIVLLAIVAMQTPARGQALPDRDDRCDPLWIRPVPAAPTGDIVLPVIVHYMKSTGRNHRGNDVARLFTQALLRRYFDQSQFINGTVWRQVKITLFLHRIETCRYDPAFTGQLPNQPEEIPSPTAGSDGPKLFRRVADAYNYQKVPGLDLYLWWEIGGRTVGYARPYHLSSGETTTGAVWVDRQCLETPDMVRQCPRLVAHEAGHFLGLCHVCKLQGDSPTGCTSCVPSFDGLPDCESAKAPKDAIMRSRYDGKKLVLTPPCEVDRARGEASSRIGSTPH
jgi:hypothetical protein